MGGRRVGTVVVLAGLALVAAGCGGGDDGAQSGGAQSGGAQSGGAQPPASAPAEARPAAFAFSAPALGGGTVEGSDYADTGVALWFWAPW